jgi:prepilin-type N-terminal cleavage/methylation domain-containing protein
MGSDPRASVMKRRSVNTSSPSRADFSPPSTIAPQKGGLKPTQLQRTAAFSLIEVIVAVVIFAIGMVAVLGLFAPVTKSVSTVSDSEAAARAADAVRARLQALPFDQALALVQEVVDVRRKDGDGAYNPNDGTKYPAVIFGKLSGDVGIYDAGEGRKAWYDSTVPTAARVEDRDKFFEIDLIRNDTLTPKALDATSPLVAYTMRVRWPAFVAASSGAAVQVGANPIGGGQVPYDHSKKQVLFFTGSILR